MAYGLNRAEVIGRLGQDAEVKHFQSGGRVARFSVATDESYFDQEKGEPVKKTEWHNVVTFQKGLVDMLEKHAKKGRLVFVSGKLQTRSFRKENETTDRSVTEMLLIPSSKVTFLDKREEENGEAAEGEESQKGEGGDAARTEEQAA